MGFGPFVEQRFRMSWRIAVSANMLFPISSYKVSRNVETEVKIGGTKQGLDNVAQDIVAIMPAIVARLLAEAEPRFHPDGPTVFGACPPRYKHRKAVGEGAFLLIGEEFAQPFSHRQTKNAVAKKFQSLIIVRSEARMSERWNVKIGIARRGLEHCSKP